MPGPHKFAALMLVKASPDQIDLNREALDTLFEQQLAALESSRPAYTVRARPLMVYHCLRP
ncbi:hypothetical protein [Paraburkholderia sp. A1RI-2L]|uniref:hypothetical protein n=1 Tax=Paraburkholderia sp. A1RI-2L TaxID=3028367 RepID=UPI003B9FED0B